MLRDLALDHPVEAIPVDHSVDGPVDVGRHDSVSVWTAGNGRREAARIVHLRGLVRAQRSAHDRTARQPKEQLSLLGGRPCQAGDAAFRAELVADALALAPVGAQLVHKDDVVALRDRELRAVRTERHCLHEVRFRSLLRRFRCEFVALLAALVKQRHDAIYGAHRKTHVVRRPRHGHDLAQRARGLYHGLQMRKMHCADLPLTQAVDKLLMHCGVSQASLKGSALRQRGRGGGAA
mmetsp:Transcript_13976/g.52183  ORF Transcript_13976/g.52183 Transcript_13976/m.52183 type:complete len:236 (+) Transcript_13976:1843-2550(+)